MLDLNISPSFIQTTIRFIFYTLSAGTAAYGFLAIYSLLLYSKNKLIALTASGIFIYIFLTLFTTGIITLSKIKF